ncbi:MAG: HAD family phosphatase [Chloroflexota bacterium]
MQTQAVIFDLDGLLVDTEPLHWRVFNAMLARRGVAYEIQDEEFGREFVGISQRENSEYLIARFGIRASADELTREHRVEYERIIADPKNLMLMPGARDVFDELRRRGVRMAIASGSPRTQVETILRGLGISALFRAIVTGSDVANLKPAPDVYLRACAELRVDAACCLALEDSAVGAAAAKAAGLRVIVVPNRYTRHQGLALADARVESLAQAVGLL